MKALKHPHQSQPSSQWMKPYLPSHTLNLRSQQPRSEEANEAVGDEEVKEVEAEEATVETVAAVEAGPRPNLASIKAQNTPICRLVIGQDARCISDTDAKVISAPNPSHVLGRTSLPPSLQMVQTIETGTSLAPPTINSISNNYILLCTTKTITRKYIV